MNGRRDLEVKVEWKLAGADAITLGLLWIFSWSFMFRFEGDYISNLHLFAVLMDVPSVLLLQLPIIGVVQGYAFRSHSILYAFFLGVVGSILSVVLLVCFLNELVVVWTALLSLGFEAFGWLGAVREGMHELVVFRGRSLLLTTYAILVNGLFLGIYLILRCVVIPIVCSLLKVDLRSRTAKVCYWILAAVVFINLVWCDCLVAN